MTIRSQPAPALMLRASTLAYLGVMVALPLATLTYQASEPGWAAFHKALVDPFAWHALKLTIWTALVMVVINAVTGTATAWVLVRYEFPGKGIMKDRILLAFDFGEHYTTVVSNPENFIDFESEDFKGETRHPTQVIIKSNETGAYGIGAMIRGFLMVRDIRLAPGRKWPPLWG